MDKRTLNIIPNPLFIYDAEWKVCEANTAALSAFGFQDIDELKGKNIFSVVHQNDHQKLLDVQQQLKDNIYAQPIVNLLLANKYTESTAQKYTSSFSKIIGYPAENEISFMVSAIRQKDTAGCNKKIYNEPENLRILSDNIPGLEMFLIDRSLNVQCKLGQESLKQGWHSAMDEETDFFKYFSPEAITILKPLLEIAFDKTPISREFSVNNIFMSINIIPLFKEMAEPLCVVVLQNITDTKLTENKLRLYMHKAEEANRAKDSFVAKMSHEIRTPLNAILGFTEQLISTRLTKKQAGYLDVVNNSSRHLLSIIDDILILSKIESGTIELDEVRFNLVEVFNEIDHLLEMKYKKKKLAFHTSVEKRAATNLMGDVAKLKQVLINLVNNAIKFTPKGAINLKAIFADESKQSKIIRFEVTDTGIGIEPDEIRNIFKPFRQVNNQLDRNFSGCGLGLTISKDIVASMGGKLSVDSVPGQGSTFSFTLTLKQAVQEVVKKHEDFEKPMRKIPENLRILFVDDDPINLLLGKIILQKHKIPVDFASSGAQAIKQFSPGKYDLVFLDINMPDVSGLEVTQHIREVEMKDRIPHKTTIVAMTANAVKKYLRQYLKAGMDTILLKPYSEEALRQKILRHSHGLTSKSDISPEDTLTDAENDIYNLTDLLTITKQDQDFTKLMLNIFIENSEDMIQTIKASLSENNYYQIGEVAHKILPSLEQLGMNKAVDLFKIIEKRYLYTINAKKDNKLIWASIKELDMGVKAIKQALNKMESS